MVYELAAALAIAVFFPSDVLCLGSERLKILTSEFSAWHQKAFHVRTSPLTMLVRVRYMAKRTCYITK